MRRALVGTGLVWSVLLLGCDDDNGRPNIPANPDDLIAPPEWRSHHGVLDVSLTAGPAEITVAGVTFTSNVYEGTYVPPVLRVARGDRVHLDLINQIDVGLGIDQPQPTNLHYHGMAISPLPPADYIYLSVLPEAVDRMDPSTVHSSPQDTHPGHFEYDWTVPLDHPMGEHWYHPHAHGLTEPQNLGGMSGMLIVEGALATQYPELTTLRERVLYLKDIDLPGAADGAPKTKTINGQREPTIRLRPGEWQVWSVGNIGADAFFDLAVDGSDLWVLSLDGNLLTAPEPRPSVYLVPSSRTQIVVGGLAAGRYDLVSREVETGPQGDPNPQVKLATLVVEGEPVSGDAVAARLRQPAANPAAITPSAASVRALPITRQRRIVFSETADGDTFFIDGREFDPHRIDTSVQLGDVEEWTIVNVSGELHTFHIHQLDFLVTSFRAEQYDTTGLRDVIDVPFQRDGVPGEVTMIIPFTNPLIVGKFPYHCHIMEHEDNGMMANIEVRPAPP